MTIHSLQDEEKKEKYVTSTCSLQTYTPQSARQLVDRAQPPNLDARGQIKKRLLYLSNAPEKHPRREHDDARHVKVGERCSHQPVATTTTQ